MQTLTVRDAVHRDIPALGQIMPMAFGLIGGLDWQNPAFVAEGLASCAADLSAKQKVRVAQRGTTVVGASYSGLALSPDHSVTHPQVGIISGVAVQPVYRRLGIGRALAETCHRQLAADGAQVILAEVRPAAVEFFCALGYQQSPGRLLLVPAATGTYRLMASTTATVLMWRDGTGGRLATAPNRLGATLSGLV